VAFFLPVFLCCHHDECRFAECRGAWLTGTLPLKQIYNIIRLIMIYLVYISLLAFEYIFGTRSWTRGRGEGVLWVLRGWDLDA
jgi:hypothetical protein